MGCAWSTNTTKDGNQQENALCNKYRKFCICLGFTVLEYFGFPCLVTSKQCCPTAYTFICYFTVQLTDVELDSVWLGRVQWVHALEEAGLDTDFGSSSCTQRHLKCPVTSQLGSQLPTECSQYLGRQNGQGWEEIPIKAVIRSFRRNLAHQSLPAWSKFSLPELMGTVVTQSQCLVVSLGQDLMCRNARVLCHLIWGQCTGCFRF